MSDALLAGIVLVGSINGGQVRLGFRVSGSGFRVSGFGFCESTHVCIKAGRRVCARVRGESRYSTSALL
jgi:hypothetical protein